MIGLSIHIKRTAMKTTIAANGAVLLHSLIHAGIATAAATVVDMVKLESNMYLDGRQDEKWLLSSLVHLLLVVCAKSKNEN
jgi:uncharacterized protein with von Willebrand factor type A (vWA) domain